MPHTHTITITYPTSTGKYHALFHRNAGGLVDRVDIKHKKSGSEEHREVEEISVMINAMIADGKSLTRIQEMLGKKSIMSKIIEAYIEVTK